MKTLNIQFVSKKIDEQWEAAVISDGKFARALTGKDLTKLIMSQLTALLSLERSNDTEVTLNLTITDAPEKKNEGEEKNDGAK